ncbi:MAG: ImmA/IrrE family metallo-endopeptidase [Verrucomicrobiae bacterium]|nr:ImmA/IrrE family metallo-endopeptidase [Verrucomicrobiae bacterium]MCP5539072.1 ImmA/IrrE family metallo-endopeptidase [Akkermansiaceae bacterium]MCP5551229.1 ImmA/IrrE family metallo-endopeptidase [Akkermansiaceae bacterium]
MARQVIQPNPVTLPVDPEYPGPKETGWTKRTIDSLATEIAEKLGYQPGQDLEPLVERLNGRVVIGPVDATGSTGFLKVEGDGSFLIALSPLPGENRNRFTIAHELGHYFLHAKVGRQRLYATRQAGSRAEWEANWFAGAFLMPAGPFLAAWNSHNGRAGYLISRFRVSGGAIQIRADTLREMGRLDA